jgi:ankyrin repeat protein
VVGAAAYHGSTAILKEYISHFEKTSMNLPAQEK